MMEPRAPDDSTSPTPTLPEALLPLLTMLILFLGSVVFLETSAELLVVILLLSAGVAGAVARRHGVGWDRIQAATGERLAAVLPGILILLAIGLLIATWVLSGTVPFLVYWGVRLLDPEHLVVTAFLSTACMSLVTGTSWGSAGTIGVALMGTAAALDVPLPVTAGAVVSGAYFGDKLSPLSDTTNCSAIGAGAPLYTHIRHMLWTAVPSFVAAILVYTLVVDAGTGSRGQGLPESARVLLADLEAVFHLGWIVLLPPAVVIWSITRKIPPALALAASSLLAAIIGIAAQGFGVLEAVAAAVAGFRVEFLASAGVDPAEVGPAFVTLVERGGLYSMANTLVLILSAFLLAGAMHASGSLDLLIRTMLGAVRSVFGLVAATMASGGVMIALTSHGLVTALVIGELFQGAYDEQGMARENLSRSLEDSVTITEPIMPWTVSALFMATTLGVSTVSYAPWAVFCYGGPMFSLVLAGLYRRTGIGLTRAARS
ncbi:MAG: Na+/H+ antiporter NhaC [Gemmatimonadales bacterium]|nr:MAG: Na+/H+ antiporter NhaC [Gemmatimonadales bacterium]